MKVKERGITLIALVITIIVLLILAGVAISMLSGENGILRKAAEAKTKTEESQKEENNALVSMELTTYLTTENSKYKCSYGYLTGFTIEMIDDEYKVKDTVQELQSALPNGYTILAEDGTTNFTALNDENNPIVTTGLKILNNRGEEAARTVVIGDVDCDGIIGSFDANDIISFNRFEYSLKLYEKVAVNVYNDEEANQLDVDKILDYIVNEDLAGINEIQKINIKQPKNLKRYNAKIHEFIGAMKEGSPYKFEYNKEDDKYILKGVTKGTIVEELKQWMPNTEEFVGIGTSKSILEDTAEVTGESKIIVKFKYINSYRS